MDKFVEILLAYAPDVAGYIAAIVFSALWLRIKNERIREIIKAVAASVVATQNRQLVLPAKADPRTGVGVLPRNIAKEAKAAAMQDAVTAIANLIDPRAGVVTEAILPVLDEAIEAAVEAAKPKLPQATLNKFPDAPPSSNGSTTLLGIVVAALCAGAALAGCVTVPDGWSMSNADNVEAVAQAAAVNVFGEAGDNNETARALRTIGRAACAQYWADAGAADIDKQQRMRNAARAALNSGHTTVPELKSYPALADAIRATCAAPANDADQVLGLVLAAIRHAADSPAPR